MGLISFFKSPERGVYLVCVVAGLIVYLLSRPAFWAPYAGMMVTYHLFLLYILFGSDNELSRSHSIPATVFGHLLCVALLVTSKIILVYAAAEVVRASPLIVGLVFAVWSWKIIAVVQFLITYGLATHERDFLFAGEQAKYARKDEATIAFGTAVPAVAEGVELALATGEDHRDWLMERQKKTVFYAPGTSAAHDFEQWLRARGKTQYGRRSMQSNPAEMGHAGSDLPV